jgi:hypothetical protein
MVPVVLLGRDSLTGDNPFYDASSGPNVWEYYFEPVAGISSAEAENLVRTGKAKAWQLNAMEIVRLHHWESRSVFTYPYQYYKWIEDRSRWFDARWWRAQRVKGRRLVERYVRVRPEILEKADRFQAARFRPAMLGVHIRGTDKKETGTGPVLSRIVPPDEYFPAIDEYLRKQADAGIFLATDQAQFREALHARYGDRVVWYSELLSRSAVNVFQVNDAGPVNRLKGEEVLIDALLLSRCDFMFKCTSAVGEFAHYFSPRLQSLDLNFATLPTTRPRDPVARIVREAAVRVWRKARLWATKVRTTALFRDLEPVYFHPPQHATLPKSELMP